ncbi:MAG: HRDC domain-containing protein, partial [Pseudomonadota bacterium]
ATLAEIAATKPVTHDDLARIGGVGATKLDRFGDAFLEVVREFRSQA